MCPVTMTQSAGVVATGPSCQGVVVQCTVLRRHAIMVSGEIPLLPGTHTA